MTGNQKNIKLRSSLPQNNKAIKKGHQLTNTDLKQAPDQKICCLQ